MDPERRIFHSLYNTTTVSVKETSEMTISALAKKSIPAGYHTLNVHVAVFRARTLIDQLKDVFDAREKSVHVAPNGRIINAEIEIGDSTLLIGEQLPSKEPFPAQIYMYVGDVDALYVRAIKSGWTSIEEPGDQPYGERRAAVEDDSGNRWWIASRK